jgi:hypothetical protein
MIIGLQLKFVPFSIQLTRCIAQNRKMTAPHREPSFKFIGRRKKAIIDNDTLVIFYSSCFAKLSNDVIGTIFEFIPIDEVLCSRLICKSWKTILEEQIERREAELKCLQTYYLTEKPSYLTWEQFFTELQTYSLKLGFPIAGWCRFEIIKMAR